MPVFLVGNEIRSERVAFVGVVGLASAARRENPLSVFNSFNRSIKHLHVFRVFPAIQVILFWYSYGWHS